METTPAPGDGLPRNPMQPVFELMKGGDPDAICARFGIDRAELDKRYSAYQASRRQMALADNLVHNKAGRNDPCPCGSGKKYKKCCLEKHEEARRNMPADQREEMDRKAKLREQLEKQVEKGFELLMAQEFEKARRFAGKLVEGYPEDDRLNDILVTVSLAMGDYEDAFHLARRRWQTAIEEKAFYQENGYHKREGVDRSEMVHFYSPSTWLEKFWIAQRARHYAEAFPAGEDRRLAKMAAELKIANDPRRFPTKQEEGYDVRLKALAPALDRLKAVGPAAIPHLLPLTYSFSWASLFVPDLFGAYGTDESIKLLAELSMFRFPYFAQKCLVALEQIGERAIPQMDQVLMENQAFDELKVGLIAVLGNLRTPESFAILTRLVEHESPYVVNWAAQALGRHQNPDALPFLEKAKERLGNLSKIAGAMQDLAKQIKR